MTGAGFLCRFHVFVLLMNIFCCCVKSSFSSTKSKEWLGTMSPK